MTGLKQLRLKMYVRNRTNRTIKNITSYYVTILLFFAILYFTLLVVRSKFASRLHGPATVLRLFKILKKYLNRVNISVMFCVDTFYLDNLSRLLPLSFILSR